MSIGRVTLMALGLLMCGLAAGIGCEAESKSNPSGDADTDTDTDADGDGDADGDTDTTPQDTDGDGLADEYEEELGTDPNNPDSDGDGVSDLVEVTAGTDPNDPDDNPHSNGDFYFLVPFGQPPEPPEDTLVFSTNLQVADLFILMDTTGSMGGCITNLKTDLSSIIIPEVADIIPDVWFGVGRFDDYPVSPYGDSSSGDVVFELVQRTTGDMTVAQAAVDSLNTHYGGDGPESDIPALWATATGDSLGTYLPEQTECEADEIGYPCFRFGAVPIIMLVTDAEFHNAYDDSNPYTGITPDPPDWGDAAGALNEIHAKVTSVWVDGWSGLVEDHCNQMAWDTNTVDVDANPLTFSVTSSGTGLGAEVVEAVATLASDVPLGSIEAVPRDNTSDTVDATVFIDRIFPNTEGGVEDPLNPGVFCVGGLDVVDVDDDDVPDKFVDVLPGTSVCFDIIPAQNDSVPHQPDPMVYEAFIDVLGDGYTVLDTRTVFFLVPPSGAVVE